MTFSDAQRDMRHAYFGGASGLFSSGIVWLIAGGVALAQPPQYAVWALLGGGVLIHPLSVLLSKLLGRPGAATKGNPLNALAIAGTFWMLLSIPLAFTIAMLRVELFFPAMLLIIGGRYLTFSTLYGNNLYWVVGLALAFAAMGVVFMGLPLGMGALAGGIIELVFGAIVFAQERKQPAAAAASA
jgi:hypothetical protein